jgi:hypothetical protein
MTSLRELHDALFPAATTVVEPDAGRAADAVSWVRMLRARTPALEGLERGDLVIAPVSVASLVAAGTGDAAALAQALARAGSAGMLLVDERRPRGESDTLDALVEAVREAAVPTYRHGPADPAALERRIIEYLVNRRAAIERGAVELEDRLHALALRGADADALTAAVSVTIGRAVALEDEHGAALAVSAPNTIATAAAAAAGYLRRPRAAALRVGLAGGTGALAVLGDEPVGEAAAAAVRRAASFLGLELGREKALRRARDLERRGEVLPTAGPPWVVLVARQGGDEGDTIERREEARARIRRLLPARRLALRGDATSIELRAVAAPGPDDPRGWLLAGSVADLLARPVAVSEPFVEPSDRPRAEATARDTLDAALELPEPPSIARADRRDAYRLLGSMRNVPDGTRLARALLDRGGRVDGRLDPAFAPTLRAILDHGSPTTAAAALGVHRNTILYRTRSIERRTGWDLADPELRLALSVALRLVRSAQQ